MIKTISLTLSVDDDHGYGDQSIVAALNRLIESHGLGLDDLANASVAVADVATEVPDLDIDRRLGDRVHARGRLERRIVWRLCEHMLREGWAPVEVYDGEERVKVADAKSAMELIFNLDDAWLYFRSAHKRQHWVRLILGNGEDCISDYSYAEGDSNGFAAAMKRFKLDDCL